MKFQTIKLHDSTPPHFFLIELPKFVQKLQLVANFSC